MRPQILLALSCAVVACQPAPAKLSDADVAAIRANVDMFVANALARRDSAQAAEFAPNGAILPPNGPAAEGTAAVKAWMAAFPPMSDFKAKVVEVDGVGDLAYVRGTYEVTMAAAGRTPATPDHGKWVEVLRRQSDGKWLIVIDIFNSDVPLPAQK